MHTRGWLTYLILCFNYPNGIPGNLLTQRKCLQTEAQETNGTVGQPRRWNPVPLPEPRLRNGWQCFSFLDAVRMKWGPGSFLLWVTDTQRCFSNTTHGSVLDPNFYLKKLKLFQMCLYVSGFLQRPEEDTGSPEAGVTGGCESPCGCQQLNEGPW